MNSALPTSWRFSLRDLLAATTVICAALALARAPSVVWCVLFGTLVCSAAGATLLRPRGIVLAAAVGLAVGAFAGMLATLLWLQSSAIPAVSRLVAGGTDARDDQFLASVLAGFQLCVSIFAALGVITSVAVWRHAARHENPTAPRGDEWEHDKIAAWEDQQLSRREERSSAR